MNNFKSNENRLDDISRKIVDLKKRGVAPADIINRLHTLYSISDILESLLDSNYIVKSVIIENIIVVNPKSNEERDGISVLKELIEGIN